MCAHFLPSKIIFFLVVDIWQAIVGIVIQGADSPLGSVGQILLLLSRQNHHKLALQRARDFNGVHAYHHAHDEIITVLCGMLMVVWIITNEAAHSFLKHNYNPGAVL